ncbi:MAG: CvpA family protein, partial [Myxococcota bacterium]
MQGISYLDGVAGLILAVALLRGIWLGLIREAFSIAALGAAVAAVVWGLRPVEGWLLEQGDLGMWAPWLAGLLLVVGAVASVVILGRLLRRGVHAAGLGWADRAGGALLGALEGALLVVLLLV